MKKTRIFIASACLMLAVAGTAATAAHARFATVFYQSSANVCSEDPNSIDGCSTTVTTPCTDTELPGSPQVYQSIGNGKICSTPLYLQ